MNSFVDRLNGVQSSVAIKAPCLVATTENIALYGEQIIDSVSVSTGDRVLVWQQSDASENGIWAVSTSNWSRAPDFNSNRDIVKGTLLASTDGTTYGGAIFRITTSSPQIGSDIVIERFRALIDGPTLKAFGAVGDGVTDDSAAIQLALSFGGPIMGEGLEYAVETPLVGLVACSLRNATLIRSADITSVIQFTADVDLEDVIVDGGSSGGSGNLVTLSDGVTKSDIKSCVFKDAPAVGGGYGAGLVYNMARNDLHQHRLENVTCTGCANHGANILSASNLTVFGGHFSDNAGTGIFANNYSTDTLRKITNLKLIGVSCERNEQSGAVIGNAIVDDDISTDARLYGYSDPEATDCQIIGGHYVDNHFYGIAMFAQRATITGATVTGNGVVAASWYGGIVAPCEYVGISNCMISGNYAWAIDAGGCKDGLINDNRIFFNGIDGDYSAMNVGANLNLTISGNMFQSNGGTAKEQISVHVPDADGGGVNGFPLVGSSVSIINNRFLLNDSRRAVHARDNHQSLTIVGNTIRGGDEQNHIIAISDDVVLRDNVQVLENSDVLLTLDGSDCLVVPDAATTVSLNTTTTVAAVLTSTQAWVGMTGIAWVSVTNGGSGYTSPPTVTITGDGSGATGTAVVHNGDVIGVRVNAHGTGYTTASVSFSGGGGTGATGTAQIGVPVPTRREFTLYSYAATTLTAVPAIGPEIKSIAGGDVSVSAKQIINFLGLAGRWNI